jgi:hypothetical protein
VRDSQGPRDLTCKDAASSATEFLEERLAGASRAAFLRHIKACDPCRTYVEQIALVRNCLDKLPRVSMPRSMRGKLVEHLKKRAQER